VRLVEAQADEEVVKGGLGGGGFGEGGAVVLILQELFEAVRDGSGEMFLLESSSAPTGAGGIWRDGNP
jgi:hypothetical protein